MKSKVLAIYYPQFHQIPENNKWWGKGFTEWENVKQGRSFYPGHYQPRVPLHEDYYDLSNLSVLERHTRMAKKSGISGFCFYHYYFNGKTLLEKPIENYRDNSSEDFPYCLIWANQSWERTWHRESGNKQILVRQSYGTPREWREHFYYLLNFFKDERYIKVDNKPVFIIYIPQDIACRRQMFHLWNELAMENGFNGIFLIAMKTYYGLDKISKLYDGYMDFEPAYTIARDHSWRKWIRDKKSIWRKGRYISKNIFKNILLLDNIYTYKHLTKQAEKRFIKSEKTYAGVFAGWDNTARKDEDGLIVTGCSPAKFGRALRNIIELSEIRGKQFIFINAWNEWSEGAYLEPDVRYKYAYLLALKKEIERYL